MQIIFEKSYSISTLNVNINGRLGLTHLLRLLENIASEHAAHLGFGFDDIDKLSVLWVLTQQKLKMDKWPKVGDVLRIKTWPRSKGSIKVFRDFELYVGDKKVGECTTSWVTIDIKKRVPTAFEMNLPKADLPKVSIETEKVIINSELIPSTKELVKVSHLDMNKHVNNTKYSQWVLDSVPLKYHESMVVSEFIINFLSECHLGQEISILSDLEAALATGEEMIPVTFKGEREGTTKPVFIARIMARNH